MLGIPKPVLRTINPPQNSAKATAPLSFGQHPAAMPFTVLMGTRKDSFEFKFKQLKIEDCQAVSVWQFSFK